jgi:hypothetical protein
MPILIIIGDRKETFRHCAEAQPVLGEFLGYNAPLAGQS